MINKFMLKDNCSDWAMLVKLNVSYEKFYINNLIDEAKNSNAGIYCMEDIEQYVLDKLDVNEVIDIGSIPMFEA